MKLKDPKKTELIYAATLRLVKQHGLTALNMAAIGKEAKLGMGTLYVYFKSKEELINSLFKHLKQLNTARIYSSVKPNAPFKVNVKELYDNYIFNRVNFYEEHFFIEHCSGSHFLDKEARKLDESAFTGVFELLNRGKSELLVKEIDNALLIAHMMGSANELVNFCMQQKIKINKSFLDKTFSLCWDSIKK
ncbi:MAG: TetR/AcrR family transcriptional regulator [Bacteroidia bacterium]|nr:TetR/AcrR family transcriptional regulator [Bacteroidia bacterium]